MPVRHLLLALRPLPQHLREARALRVPRPPDGTPRPPRLCRRVRRRRQVRPVRPRVLALDDDHAGGLLPASFPFPLLLHHHHLGRRRGILFEAPCLSHPGEKSCSPGPPPPLASSHGGGRGRMVHHSRVLARKGLQVVATVLG